MGDDSVHLLGSEAAVKHRHGVDLVQIAVDNWEAFTNCGQSAPVILAPAWRAFSSQCSGTEGHAGYYRKGSGGDQADTRQHAENGFVLGHPFDGSPDPVEHDRRRSD